MNNKLIAVYSGIGIGMLIGLLMGLSVSPTVSVIIGALSTLLAALLGLNDKNFSDSKALRIGSFGFACIVGALLGIFVRSNNAMMPSIKAQYDAYIEVGYQPEQARDFIAFKTLGIINKDWKLAAGSSDDKKGEGTSGAALVQKQHANVLFGADVQLNSCDSLELDLSATEIASTDIVGNYRLEEGVWKALADDLTENLNNIDHTAASLVATRDALCDDVRVAKIPDQECKLAAHITSAQEFSTSRVSLANDSKLWAAIINRLEKAEIPQTSQDIAGNTVIQTLCKET